MAVASGYITPSVGYVKPPATPSRALATAAARKPIQSNLFGMNTAYGLINPGTTVPPKAAPIPNAPNPAPAPPPKTAVAGSTPSGATANTAPTANQAYDINTDPGLQQTLALTGLSDEEAQAAAASARRNLLLNYGDANLANSVAGDPTLAAAAAANPTSTLAQLATQRAQGVQDLTEQLNQANLLYSGYRTTQETKAAQDYQNALAQAASAVGGGLTDVTSQLNQALGANASQRAQMTGDAYQRMLQEILANPPAPPDTSAGAGAGAGPGPPPAAPFVPLSPAAAAAAAAGYNIHGYAPGGSTASSAIMTSARKRGTKG